MRHIAATLLATACLNGAQAAPEAASAPSKPRTISVSGCAVGYIQPDAILWTVEREAYGKNLQAAKSASEDQVKTLLEACAKKGIQGNDVSLSMIEIKDARTGQAESPQDSVDRFTVSRTITLRQRDLQVYHELLGIVSRGTGKVTYKRYCSRVNQITRDTLLRATAAAKEKAGAMATVLGASLGPVLTVSEYAPANSADTKAEDTIVDDASPVYSAGAEKLCIVVYVTFELQ